MSRFGRCSSINFWVTQCESWYRNGGNSTTTSKDLWLITPLNGWPRLIQLWKRNSFRLYLRREVRWIYLRNNQLWSNRNMCRPKLRLGQTLGPLQPVIRVSKRWEEKWCLLLINTVIRFTRSRRKLLLCASWQQMSKPRCLARMRTPWNRHTPIEEAKWSLPLRPVLWIIRLRSLQTIVEPGRRTKWSIISINHNIAK